MTHFRKAVGLVALATALTVSSVAAGAAASDGIPANDDIVNAFSTNLTGGNGGLYPVVGTVTGATPDQPSDVIEFTDKRGPHSGGHSVWYRIPNPGRGRLRIAGVSRKTNFDAVVAVYHGPANGILSTADLAPGPDGGNGQRFGTRRTTDPIDVPTTPGFDYVVVADSYGGTVGVPITTFTFGASFTPAPVNDDIAGALPVDPNSGRGRLLGTVAGATSDQPVDVTRFVGKHRTFLGDRSVWYKIAAPGAGRLRVAGISKRTGLDAGVAVFHGPAGGVASTADLAPGPDGGNAQRFGSRRKTRPLEIVTTPGHDYYIAAFALTRGSLPNYYPVIGGTDFGLDWRFTAAS